MHAKKWPMLLVLILAAAPARVQESVRDLSGAGQHDKFLTPNQLDRWLFEGEKGETVIAHVVTKQFDPILELTQTLGKEDKVLKEVDDPGSESRFSIRLPATGKYEIRIHAYKYQGGGNYSLRVQRFQAKPLAVGKPVTGTFDREGKSYHYFQVAKDQILIPDLKGASPDAWKMLDGQGRDMPKWVSAVSITENGEGHIVVNGQPDYRYTLLVREGRQQELTQGKALSSKLQQGELDAWSFQGQPGEFRLLEVEKTGETHARLIYAPLEKSSDKSLARPGMRPEIAFIPVASRGGSIRFAAVLGRAGRYQFQVLAETAASYKVTLRDPSVPIEVGKEIESNLPVGGAAFYSVTALPGQLLHAGLASKNFVPMLRLYDDRGSLVSSSDDDALESRITHMVLQKGTYRLQVSSLGDGGGGDFRQTLTETKLKELTIGGRGTGAVQPGATDFWAFPGKEGQVVFLSVRSGAFEPLVSVRSPEGVLLSADNRGNAATGSLIALRLPRTGRYTVWISSRRGAGEYAVRLIDGD